MDKSIESVLNRSSKWRQFKCLSALYWISISIGISVGITTVQCQSLVTPGDDVVQMTDDQVSKKSYNF